MRRRQEQLELEWTSAMQWADVPVDPATASASTSAIFYSRPRLRRSPPRATADE